MNPHQQNKIDIKSLSEDEQRLLRMYGKIPNKKDLLQNKLKERKYFDSGDYALSKAGKASDVGVTSIGSRHPLPENIPHLVATSPPQSQTNIMANHVNGPGHVGPHSGPSPSTSRTPVKEGSFLHRESSLYGGEDGLESSTDPIQHESCSDTGEAQGITSVKENAEVEVSRTKDSIAIQSKTSNQ